METETKKFEGERTIPQEVISTHILPRLASKDLARFKCVCRGWNATISTLNFAIARMKMLGFVEHQILMLTINFPEVEHGEFQGNEYSEIKCLSYDETGLKEVVDMNCPLKHVGKMGVNHHIIGSCNGLICLYLVYEDRFGIWNPNTNQYCQVPICSQSDGMILDAEGFGYRAETNDYYIFNMFSNKKPAADMSLSFFLFTFCTGLWRELAVPDRAVQFATSFGRAHTGMFVQGRLYWPRRNSITQLIQGLFCFDLATQELNPIHVSPLFLQFRYDTVDDIFELNGNLSVSCHKGYQMGHVWVFRKEESGNYYSWVNAYKYDVAAFEHDVIGQVLSFTPSGLYLTHLHHQIKLLDVTKDDGGAKDGTSHTYAGVINKSCLHLPTFIPIRIVNPN